MVALLAAYCVATLAWTGAVHAARADGHSPMRVRGDYVEIDNDDDTVVIKGNAFIEFGDMKLWADSIQGHLQWNEVQAQGNVRFWRSDERLAGHMLVYNYRTRRGRISELRTKRGVNYIKAARMEIEPWQLRGYEVQATTCDENPPHYYVSAREMILYPHDRMILHDVALVMGGKARVRFPKYEIDMKTGQRANRLYISPGYSASKGFTLKSAYSFYFGPKVRGRAYFHPSQHGDHRAGLEVLYDPDDRTSGQAAYSTYRSETLSQDEQRMHLQHQQRLSKTSSLSVDTLMTSVSRYGSAADEELNLVMQLAKTLPNWDLNFDVSKRVDLDGDSYAADTVIQSLDTTPRLRFRQRRPHEILGSGVGLLVEGRVERLRETSTLGVVESMKEEAIFNLSPKPIEIGRWSKWNWNVREQLSFYSGHEDRQVFGLNVSTQEKYGKHWTTSVSYALQRVSGSTPFRTYDLLNDQNSGTWYLRYNLPERVTATVFQASYDFLTGLFTGASSNVVFRNPSSDAVRWSAGLTANYALGDNRHGLSDLSIQTLSGNFRIERPKAWRHNVIANYDMQTRRMTSITTLHDFLLTPTVRFQANANLAYSVLTSSLDVTRLNLALVKDYHCWEGRLRWDIEQKEAFIEFYLKASARKKLSIGIDYDSELDLDAQMVDGERPGTSFSSF